MNFNAHTQPHALERYAFIWSEVRLLVAALALLLGGIPPALYLFPRLGLVFILLKAAWLLSGVASIYLIYRYLHHHQTVFGARDLRDRIAFFVMTISGLNLGIVGLLGRNIGMSISSSRAVFIIVAIVYLVCAYHLYVRSRVHGGKLFG